MTGAVGLCGRSTGLVMQHAESCRPAFLIPAVRALIGMLVWGLLIERVQHIASRAPRTTTAPAA
jgi:hypothetical protein